MTGPAKKSRICRQLERDLYHFQAGELSDGEQRLLAEHLEECPPCAGLARVEDSFLRGLKGRLTPVEAPPELRARLRQALDRQPEARRPASWLRAPWLMPAAAAMLLAVLMLPTFPRVGAAVPVESEVTVVDIDCEYAGRTLAEQRNCTHPHHLNALRVASDRYWNIGTDEELGRRLASDRDMRGHRLHVVGELYAGLHTLHVTEYTDEDLERELSAGLAPSPVVHGGRLSGL